MKPIVFSFAFLTLAACGSTNPFFWEKCDSAPCNTGPTSRWDVYADGGDVDGSHDFIGPPDPYICLSVGGKTECSSSVSDSNHPRWSDLLFSDVPASSLVGKSLGVRYMDKDTDSALDSNDTLCTGSVTITEADLAKGGVEYECSTGNATFTFHFLR